MTNVDHTVDQLLTAALSQFTPDTPVFSEERDMGSELPDRYWMIDPIDGTANLLAGIPFVGIAAALVHDSQVKLAGVASLFDGTVYSAEKGKGAYHDAKRVSPPSTPVELIGVSSGVLASSAAHPALVAQLRRFGKIRNLGSQALQLCAVASGQLGANISAEAKLWDDQAGALIAQEAGAIYAARPQGNKADDEQRSLCCHPSFADALTDIADTIWPKFD